MPEFEGKFLLVEGYDLRLARRLVSGVDVWLNNPIFPLEASGTSGMKAGFNGTINLSVLDGWWGEGYNGANGWAIKPASEQLSDERRNLEESRSLYELLQDKVIPLYYERGKMGFSPEWIQMAKRSIEFVADGYAVARELASWKRRVRAAWTRLQLRALDRPKRRIDFGDNARFTVGVRMEGMGPEDIVIELLLGAAWRELAATRPLISVPFTYSGEHEGDEYKFTLDLAPELCGKLEYRIRAYPSHRALSHRFEMGLMKWI